MNTLREQLIQEAEAALTSLKDAMQLEPYNIEAIFFAEAAIEKSHLRLLAFIKGQHPHAYIERAKLIDKVPAQVVFQDANDNFDSVPLYTDPETLLP